MTPASITKIRTDREARARRHLELARLLRNDPQATNVELAKALNVSRNTIMSDRLAIMNQVNKEALTETQLYRDDQLTRIAAKWDEIEYDETMTGSEKHLAWSRWMKLEMDLRGTAAPSKSISASVTVDAENIGPYRKFVLACSGLDEHQIEQLFVMAREMPRKPFVMVQPPKTSPLWTKNQLTEGDDAS